MTVIVEPTPVLNALYEDHMGDDLAVVNAAKVSFGNRSQWETGFTQFENGEWSDVASNVLAEKDARLINYLARGMTKGDYDTMLAEILMSDDADEIAAIVNKYRNTPLHKSPFNHCFLRFHIKAPIFVARQLVKHEYLVWNEISGRYVEFDPVFYYPKVWRSKAADKKQGSGEPLPEEAARKADDILVKASQAAYRAYKELLRTGACEEQARVVLPSNLITEWIWSGSLGAFSKMCQLRLGHDAQPETAAIARSIGEQIAPYFPVSWKALMTNGNG